MASRNPSNAEDRRARPPRAQPASIPLPSDSLDPQAETSSSLGGTNAIDEKNLEVTQPEWYDAMLAVSNSMAQALSQSLTEQMRKNMDSLESRMVKNVTRAMSNRDPAVSVHPVDFTSMREAYDTDTSDDGADDHGPDGREHDRQPHARASESQGPPPSSSQRSNAPDGRSQSMHRAPTWDSEAAYLQSDFPPLSRARSRNHRPSNVRYNDADANAGRKVIDVLKKYEGPKFVLSNKRKKYADDWIRSFDNWFRGRVGDPYVPDRQYGDAAIRLVLLAVQDHSAASEWCRNRVRSGPTTYDAFMHDFSEAFMSMSEARRRVQPTFLQGKRQRAEEPILRYNIKFQKRVDLHRAACGHANRVPDERLLLTSYAAGLHDKQNSVRAMKRRTLNDAMQYLQNKEAIYREVLLARAPNSKGKDIDSDDEATSDDGSQDSSSDDDDSSAAKSTATKAVKEGSKKVDAAPDGWKEEIKTLSKGVEALSLLLNGQIKSLRARTPGAPMATAVRDMSKIQCYNCEDYGHYSSKCPKPAKPKTLLVQQYLGSGPKDPESVSHLAAFLAAVDIQQQEESMQQSSEEDF